MKHISIFSIPALLLITIQLQAQQMLPDTSWVQQHSGTDDKLHSVQFIDDSSGWIAGEKTLIGTTNAGEDWIMIDSLEDPMSWYRDLHIDHKDKLWTILQKDTILDTLGNTESITVIRRSMDSGVSWDEKFRTSAYLINKIIFSDTLHGFLIGSDGVILRSTDGGENWTDTLQFGPLLRDIFFVSDSVGYIAGDQSLLLKTTNAGLSWDGLTNIPAYSSFSSVFFLDENQGWAGGSLGRMFYTTDSGSTWDSIQFNQQDYFQDIFFKSQQIGWACSANGRLHYTQNNGNSWQVYQAPAENLREIYFSSADYGWVVGSKGTILFTNNGGGEIGVDEHKQGNLIASVFPNPFHEKLWISLQLKNNDRCQLSLYTLSGTQIESRTLNELEAGDNLLNAGNHLSELSGLKPGLYLLEIINGSHKITKSIIKL